MNLSAIKISINMLTVAVLLSASSCGKKKNNAENAPPEYFETVSEFSLSGPPFDLAMYNDYAVIALGEKGLAIVDLKTQASPVLVNEIKVGSDVRHVEIMGDNAIILDALEGLQVVNIKDPNRLSLTSQLGLIEIGDYAHDLLVVPELVDYVFLATHLNGVRLYDVASLASPKEMPLKLSDNLTLVNSLFVSPAEEGRVKLFTSSHFRGVNVYDVNIESGDFTKLGTLNVAGHAKKIFYDGGDKVYVAALDGGLQVFNISDLDNITGKTLFNSPRENVTDFALTGSRVIAVSQIEGSDSYTLNILDINEEGGVSVLETRRREGRFGALTIIGDDIIVSDANIGITTFRFNDLKHNDVEAIPTDAEGQVQ